MMLLILACADSEAASATAAPPTLVELELLDDPKGFTAPADAPGAIVVACENEDGSYTYGPKDDVPRIFVGWNEAEGYTIELSDGFVDCRVWAVR